MADKILRVGTLFSGIGAPEQALKTLKIPHAVKWACDNDKRAKETYFKNHSCEKWFDDVTTIDAATLEPVDLLIAGFPCQDASTFGKMDLAKGRTALVEYALNIIDAVKPRYVLLENVRGLLSKKFKPFLEGILARLAVHYNFDMRLLNSRFWGVPQNRPRVFILATRKDLAAVPLPVEDQARKTPVASVLEPNPAPFYTLTDDQWRKIRESFARRPSFPLRFCKETCWTILTTYYSLPAQFIEQDGKNPRKLTERECARLQGFPDSFILPDNSREAYKQLGNTMTVNVLAAIFDRLFGGLENS